MKRLSRKFEFDGAFGDRLAGLLELPSGRRRGVAIFAHCFTCSKDSHAAARISRSLAEQGIAVLRFDFTGLGSSSGDFSNTNFSSNVDDLLAAAEALSHDYGPPNMLIGHSLGGAAVLMAASRMEGLRGVVTIGAPSDVDHVKYNFRADLPRIEADGVAEVDLVGRKFTIRQQFLDDIKAQDVLSVVKELSVPVAFLHAPDDEIVEQQHAENLYQVASQPKSIMALDGADHLLNKRAGSNLAADLIVGWSRQYLDTDAADATDAATAGKAGYEPGQAVLTETDDSKFSLTIALGHHNLVADEPAVVGGKDLGPDPFGYVMIGLGACTVMTMRMYADHKGWPVGTMQVAMNYDASKDPETGDRHQVFTRRVSLSDQLTAEQKARVIEIANKCPVHRMLTEETPEIITQLVE
ncbi:MAG: alpha/beta fold hydrolase [Pseudomonadota bacterium]